MVKNNIARVRIDGEMKSKIKEICEKLKMDEPDILRLLINNSLKRLRADIQKYGIENLEFTIRHD